MSDEYYCTICLNSFPMLDAEYLGSTEDDCKGCFEAFMAAKELLQPLPAIVDGVMRFRDSDDEMPNRIALMIINLGRPLGALNFCLSSLDIISHASPGHPFYDRRAALKDLLCYNKSDFNPNLAPPIKFNPRASSYLLYTCSLAAFKVYGPSHFAVSCLRRAYHSNPTIYQLLSSAELGKEFFNGFERALMYLQFKRLWEAPETQEWLEASREDARKRICDDTECGKVEEKIGEWGMCGGCRKRWYCGAECQTRDWRTGGHKEFCKQEQSFRKMINSIPG